MSTYADDEVRHCRETLDCPMYPYDACFAEKEGLVCHMVRDGGFEMAVNQIYTFVYAFQDLRDDMRNDTGEPCFTIPRSEELSNYVKRRGPMVIEEADLDLIGNCTYDSYCDPKSKTCQPKRDVGEACEYNEQCHFNMRRYPGHCSNTSVCIEREDAIQLLYPPAFQKWEIGEHWQQAAVALTVTATAVICFYFGRQQAGAMVGGVQVLIEKWQNGSSVRNRSEEEENGFLEPTSSQPRNSQWTAYLPFYSFFSHRFRQAGEGTTYIQLAGRERNDAPPDYRD
ncbi:hypothetical protein INT44_002095 [Umbelopsis vinacea]|uniref:Uncharacterized protein n=1 Tax=Umbelopsis vinacea TaxID=44442 RepID=A0A8H7Q4C8_9FUNG|nr:hypothetical protein INT44_002095 [Umbelopsis vinacea]